MSTIDIDLLSYDFDEERGFGEPASEKAERLSIWQHAARIGIWIATAVLILGLADGLMTVHGEAAPGFVRTLLGWAAAFPSSSWIGWLSGFGLLSVSASTWFILKFKDTTPGIKHDGSVFSSIKARGLLGVSLAVGIIGFYVVLYWYEDLTGASGWKEGIGFPRLLEGWIRMSDPLSLALSGNPADQWFLYGMLYTLAVLIFGVRMFMKYRHNRYQLLRTMSVMLVQLGLAFLIPNALKRIDQAQGKDFYFSYFWPLKPEYMFPGTVHEFVTDAGVLGSFLIGWSIIMIAVATPVLTFFFGKRWYCSWVCGCGGLAETLGDPWRNLSSKTTVAWHVERYLIHAVLGAIVLLTALLWINNARENDILGTFTPHFHKAYLVGITMIFAGVVGTGFYPLMGSRVWCRFGCPMAAILGILQRTFSRFRITTNGGQCMSCGNCSTYCEMGIDVRAYAQRGEDIVRASCVGCGVCAAVCPRGVLRLENGNPTRSKRFDDDDGPVTALLESLRQGARPDGDRSWSYDDPLAATDRRGGGSRADG